MKPIMKNIASKTIAPATLLAFLCAYAAAQTGTTPPGSPTPAPIPSVDSGTITGSTYQNDYFGMRLTIPEGWTIYDAQGRRMLIEQGRQQFTINDKKVQAQLDAGAARTVNMLTVSKLAENVSGTENAIFVCGAEFVRRSVSSTNPTSQDYLNQLKRVLAYAKVPYKVEDVTSEKINGNDFGVLTVSTEAPRGVVRQKYYAIMKKDFALFFVSTYINEADLPVMNKVMSSLKFQ